jgi:two-component system KDP operon response regulator KdpE
VEALDAGTDDFVTMPFQLDELLARLRALSRRAPPKKLEASPGEPAHLLTESGMGYGLVL